MKKERQILTIFCLLLLTGLPLFGEWSRNEIDEGESTPGGLALYHNSFGEPEVLYRKTGEDHTAFLEQVKTGNSSLPVKSDFNDLNYISDPVAGNLSTGEPLLVVAADRFDYFKLFGISPDSPRAEIEAVLAEIPADELVQLSHKNRRLYYTFQEEGQWQELLPIPDTGSVFEVRWVPGTGRSALVGYITDRDGDFSTLADREVYYTFYDGVSWSLPVNISADSRLVYDLQLAACGASFMGVWKSDGDSNLETGEDTRLFYFQVDNQGHILTTAPLLPGTIWGDIQYTLGCFSGQGVLVWHHIGASGEIPEKLFWSLYNNTWSEPAEAGFQPGYWDFAFCLIRGDSLLFIFKTGFYLYGALLADSTWHSPVTLVNFRNTPFSPVDIACLAVAPASLQISSLGILEKTESAQSIYHLYSNIFSLLPDLRIPGIDLMSPTLEIGQPGRGAVMIENRGLEGVENFNVEFKINGETFKTLESLKLPAGEFQNLEFLFIPRTVNFDLEVELLYTGEESNKANNKHIRSVLIQPDYAIRQIEVDEGNVIRAIVHERKGTAAPGVPVLFTAVTGEAVTVIGEKMFEPGAGDILEIEWPALNGLTGPFRILAEVNPGREITEDNYANNTSSFEYNPLPDFFVRDIIQKESEIVLQLENRGAPSSQEVVVILTTSPEVSTGIASPAENDVYYEQRTIVSGNNVLSFPLQEPQEAPGVRFYAVINPSHTLKESDYNNNSKVHVCTSNAVGDSSHLFLGSALFKGDDIQATVVNFASVRAVAPVVELYYNNLLVSRKIIPVIAKYGWQVVTFKGCTYEKYTVCLVSQEESAATGKHEITVIKEGGTQ